ncbi:Multidrug export protein mepA [Slackia heliotrinireducens]|uniref:Na+-driven multidrug efflux pump n=1 Tax=Slackia heliotrinireducens (strain ATCC 29202 / DSM 20476 / NCTC 11029 / RHS 1) TaxID=471855 RepID=C7N598_SLAHD|nr:MATE family efflux transporter [Slackia heliotrinireducens]ACV22083.1 Na+-driven multidrug efflux pump [Slackia heliotrinireducens DSM 20476]VEH00070.1 Multidrug export protein mepA [Slackia heliotrinireducens]
MPVDMSRHFTLPQLIRFTLPTIGMMLFMSLYVMVDGFFVSNWCGQTALAAVNFAYPIPMILGTLGFMFGTGGSAIVAKTRGEGDDARANRQFSLLVYAAIVAGAAFAALGVLLLRPLLVALGAQGEMLDLCMVYAMPLVMGVPATVLQYLFQELLVTAGKPELGFGVTVAAGLTNIVVDAVLIALLDFGVVGAAIGTIAGEAVGGIIPLVYFARPNKSFLRLGRTNMDWRMLGHACVNGSSEMVSNIAMSLVSMAYNVQLLVYLGESGVAAYGVIMYVGMAFVAVFMGYVFGSSPLMSFQYGANNRIEMRSLFRKSLLFVSICGVAMFIATRVFARPLALVFVGYSEGLAELTVHAMLLYSASLLIVGFNMYGSALFTALGNGLVSAIISFVRTLIFEIGAVFLLPTLFGADGIWVSVVVAEAAALVLTTTCILVLEPRYGYIRTDADVSKRSGNSSDGHV